MQTRHGAFARATPRLYERFRHDAVISSPSLTVALPSCFTEEGCLSRLLWESVLGLHEVKFEGALSYDYEESQSRTHIYLLGYLERRCSADQ